MEINMENENIKVKKKLNKKAKALIIVVVILALIAGAFAGISANKTFVATRVIYHAMPNSFYNEDNDTTYYVRLNKDFDYKSTDKIDLSILEAFSYYYYDEDGKEVDLGANAKIIMKDESELELFAGFVPDLVDKFFSAVKALNVIMVLVIILVIMAVIVLWFFSWSKREDKKREQLYGKKNNNSKKNKNKK